MEQLKTWYFGLEEREQTITLYFTIIIAILLIYFIIIEPINSSAIKLEKKLAASQKNIDWMKKQVPIILTKKGINSSTSSLPLTSIINKSTRQYALPVSRRDSSSPNEMQVWFDNVSFDVFIRWSADIKNKYGVGISSVNIRDRDSSGITSINVKLFK